MDPMQAFVQQLVSCLSVPGKWGGNNPIQGFDCSGFAQWGLRAAGLDPKGDQTAQALYDYFSVNGDWHPKHWAGTLCFYSAALDRKKVDHVSIMLNGFQIIEAGGVRSTTLTREDAAAHGACVRIRHIAEREKEIVARIRPDFSKIGLI